MLPADLRDLAEEVRRAFEELDRAHGADCRSLPGECVPPVDVFETAEAVEIRVDLPGVAIGSVRVLIKAGTVLVVGEKMPAGGPGPGEATFHLVERSFGRFARAVRLSGAIDPTRARGVLRAGELRVGVPRITERRGAEVQVPIEVE